MSLPLNNAPARDTICAISTAPGVGGIAVCRVSGPEAIAVADRIWRGKPLAEAATHTAHLGALVDSDSEELDRGVATVFRAPRSYTGEDVVELSVHGSRYIQRELLESLVSAGARLAEPGEFTRRAFASGRLDLAQAEAVADMIASDSRASHRLARTQMSGTFSRGIADLRSRLVDLASLLELELDFSEEDVEFASRTRLLSLAREVRERVGKLLGTFATGRAIKEGIPVAIVGAPNAGKSSLLNRLLDDDRAIVSDIPGTTRDTVEETVELGDYRFRFIDTAGVRQSDDLVERLGINRSIDAIERAHIILYIYDASRPSQALEESELRSIIKKAAAAGAKIVTLANKSDLLPEGDKAGNGGAEAIGESEAGAIAISAVTGQGIELLTTRLTQLMDTEGSASPTDLIVSNVRHAAALRAAHESAGAVIAGLESGLPGDLIAQDLRDTIAHLAAITGDIPSSELLTTIFSRFCIGK